MNRRDYVETGIQIDERNEANAERKRSLEGETPEARQKFRDERGNPDSGHRGVSGITTATNTRARMYTAADRKRANTRNLTPKTEKLKSSVSDFLKDRIRSRLQNNSYEPDYDEYERIYEAMESDERQNKVEYIKSKLSEAASKNLIAYLHAKHGADAVKSMSLPQYKAAKKEAEAEMKAAKQSRRAEKETQKAEAPPAKEKPENIIMQMRRIADLKPGHYPVKVSPVRSVNVHSDTARKIIGAHDNLEKPNDKRRFRIRVVQRMRKLDEEYGYFTSEEVEPIQESSNYTLYHKSYTDAINHALAHHEKSGLLVSDGDRMDYIGLASKKPGEGKTTSINIPATHEKTDKKHMIHIQVYNKGGSHPYELNTYSSPAGRPGRRRNEKS